MVKMNCGMSCLKYFLFVFNLLVSILGIAITILGIIVSVNPDFLEMSKPFGLHGLNSAVYVVIVVGVVMFILGFLGCCGAFQESKCMLLSYVITVTILLILQIVAAALILKAVNDREIQGKVNKFLKKQLMLKESNFMDFLQSKLKCCGVSGIEDYSETESGIIPYSCSKEDNSFYDTGCTIRVMDFIKEKSVLVGGITLGAFFVQLVTCVIAVCLFCTIKQSMGVIV